MDNYNAYDEFTSKLQARGYRVTTRQKIGTTKLAGQSHEWLLIHIEKDSSRWECVIRRTTESFEIYGPAPWAIGIDETIDFILKPQSVEA